MKFIFYSELDNNEEYSESSTIYSIRQSLEDDYNLINLKGMFYNCISLSSIIDKSKYYIKFVNDISLMFYNCSSLSIINDISKYDTKNVTDMNGIFYNCYSLSSLPDISKWNTSNVIYMNDMFKQC